METPRAILAAASDLNGQLRGKRLPEAQRDKIIAGDLRMPLSVLNLDITGADIENSPLVFESGDADGSLRLTERGFVPLTFLQSPTDLALLSMYTDDGAPFEGDPRHALAAVLARYAEKGMQVVVGTELEFYLLDDSGNDLAPPENPLAEQPVDGAEILSIEQIVGFDPFFSELYRAAADMDIPLDAAISEAGQGQFEINLIHRDAMHAADDSLLFKFLVRMLARKHGLAATFMAKPQADDAGSGMHLHFSLLDEQGNNLFDDGTEDGSPLMTQAVAGCLETMADATLIFAPHANSYARHVPGAHAPTAITWGYENRTAAIRIPGGPGKARRIEHRVAGCDVNPYLVFTTILGGALQGIEAQATPPAPITGNAYEIEAPKLAPDWETAINRFEDSKAMAGIFPPMLIDNLLRTKRQEVSVAAEFEGPDWWLYLDRV